MINAVPTLIADFTALAVDVMTTPVVTGELGSGGNIRGVGAGTERTRAGKRPMLSVNRPPVGASNADGTISVYGADLPDVLSGKPLGNAYATPQTQTCLTLTLAAAIAFGANVALATSSLSTAATTAGQPATVSAGVVTNLWVVTVNGVLLRCSASPAAGTSTVPPEVTFTVTAGVVTLYVGAAGGWTGITPAPLGSDVAVCYVAAPTQILAPGAHTVELTNIQSRTVMFVVAATAITTGRTLVTLIPAVGA